MSEIQGDIAIDDFTFTTSNCSIRPMNDSVPTVSTAAPSTITTRRTTLAPQSPLDCNFEQGSLCSAWTHDPTADFQWGLQQGETASINTGPSFGSYKRIYSTG